MPRTKSWKSPLVYKTIRSLHLYLGMFVAPLVLFFAASVLVINHSHPVADPPSPELETRTIHKVPKNLESLESVQRIMEQADLSGWVTFFRLLEDGKQFRFILLRPTRRRDVSLDVESGRLEIRNRPHDLKATLYWLHTMPGPHTQHKNWFFLYLWWALADTVAYGTLFLSVSGVYLWYFLRSERKIGLLVLTLGIASFTLAVAILLA